MNKRLAIEDFGYQDFLLVKASQPEVVDAVETILCELDEIIAAETRPTWRPTHWLNALRSRVPFITRKTEENAATDAPLPHMTHEGSAVLPVELITTERGPAYLDALEPTATAADQDDVRISAIEGSDWILVEYREHVSGMSMLGFALSLKLVDSDVLYFRRSGDMVCEYHNDFHVYRNGETLRRVLCHSTWPEGEIEQEWWETVLDGEISTYEPGTLYQNCGEMDLLDNDKLEEILAQLALSSQKLFSRMLTLNPVLLSRQPGPNAAHDID